VLSGGTGVSPVLAWTGETPVPPDAGPTGRRSHQWTDSTNRIVYQAGTTATLALPEPDDCA
jgi:hypothetical protein